MNDTVKIILNNITDFFKILQFVVWDEMVIRISTKIFVLTYCIFVDGQFDRRTYR